MIRLVIADDHAVFRGAVASLLEREPDIQVIGEAGTGRETIDTVARLNPDLLLLDLSMPELSGNVVAKILRENHPTLPIVILSMHENETYVENMMGLGCKGFIPKKSKPEQLLDGIRRVSRGECYVAPSIAWKPKQRGEPNASRGIDLLSPREQEVCKLLAHGLTNAEVGRTLFISPRTAEIHRSRIMKKLELQGRGELVRFALDNNLISN